jgi:hypothetical protein
MSELLVQGDVFLVKVDTIPKNARMVRSTPRGYILATGKATGHAHMIAADIMCYEINGTLYIKNDIPVELRHEEHKPISISPGIWKVGRAREFDAFKNGRGEQIRHVID